MVVSPCVPPSSVWLAWAERWRGRQDGGSEEFCTDRSNEIEGTNVTREEIGALETPK